MLFINKLKGGCCGGEVEIEKKIKVKDADLSNYKFSKIMYVDGMHCKNCTVKVENSLNSIDGVMVKVNLKDKLVDVKMKSNIDNIDLKNAVIKAGYKVTAVK